MDNDGESKIHSQSRIKWIVVSFIVISLAVFSINSYYLSSNSKNQNNNKITHNLSPTPTLDPTINWNEGGSERFGFSIKYPPQSYDRGLNQQEDYDTATVTYTPPMDFYDNYHPKHTYGREEYIPERQIKISVVDNPFLISLAELEEKIRKKEKKLGPIDEIIASSGKEFFRIHIGGSDAMELVGGDDQNNNISTVIMPHDYKFYVIRLILTPNSKYHYTISNDIYREMVKSFKIIPIKNQYDNESLYKTFEGDNYGFSFKYPKDATLVTDTPGELVFKSNEKFYPDDSPISVSVFKETYSEALQRLNRTYGNANKSYYVESVHVDRYMHVSEEGRRYGDTYLLNINNKAVIFDAGVGGGRVSLGDYADLMVASFKLSK